jgi:uncharacterized protein (TIGR03435 family)
MARTIIRACLLVFGCVLAFAQSTQGPTFEVASVKLSPPVTPGARVFYGPARGGPGTPDPGQITWTNATLNGVLMIAYGVKDYQLKGPGWLDMERYDIIAKVPEGATKEHVKLMWQNLLAERFRVVLHHEPKEFQVEELVIGKGGSKLKATTVDPAEELDPGPPKFKDGVLNGPGYVTTIMVNGQAHSVAKAQPLSKLTASLGGVLHRPVIDKTGLTGKYDFSIDFKLDLRALGVAPATAPSDNAPDPGPDLASAVEQQLGLRLVAAKAKLDVLVIDKAEKVPTDN